MSFQRVQTAPANPVTTQQPVRDMKRWAIIVDYGSNIAIWFSTSNDESSVRAEMLSKVRERDTGEKYSEASAQPKWHPDTRFALVQFDFAEVQQWR